MKWTHRLLAGLLVLVPATLGAQSSDLTGHPGYFDLDSLEIFEIDEIEVDIDLQGPMMQMISGATAEDDPEFADVMAELKRIRVRVGTVESLGAEGIGERLEAAAAQLRASGWSQMVRVRDEGDRVFVYTRDVDGNVEGMTVLVGDDEEVALINIVGRLDFASLGKLISNMDGLADLGDVVIDGN